LVEYIGVEIAEKARINYDPACRREVIQKDPFLQRRLTMKRRTVRRIRCLKKRTKATRTKRKQLQFVAIFIARQHAMHPERDTV